MKCPRCQTSITATPDPEGLLTCPGCGAHLRSRAATATVRAMGARAAGRTPLAEGSPDEIRGVLTRLDPDANRFPDAVNPNSTLPPGTPLPRIPNPGSPEARAALSEDDTARVMRAPGPRDVPRAAGDDTARSVARNGATLDQLMAEVKALRALQEETLALLREGGLSGAGERRGHDVMDELGLPEAPAVRKRQRKTVVLLDDDVATRTATAAVLGAAEVPVRAFAEGRAAVSAIAEEKPDVIVMELDIAGSMAGKDVINLIKATMEWVDIPIVLYTRVPIAGQREARTIHGADDFVSKQDGPEPLLARVVTHFRRG
jgi:CheY-like chemotaxis protein